MKFTDGFWLMRDGVRASYATEVRDVHVSDDHLTAYAAVRRVEHRGHIAELAPADGGVLLPAEGVIGVRTTHHAGRAPRGPDFALTGADAGAGGFARTRRDGPVTELTSGPLTVRLDRSKPWGLDFLDADGRRLTGVGGKAPRSRWPPTAGTTWWRSCPWRSVSRSTASASASHRS